MANQHLFSQVPNINIQRSSFDRSHEHKTTLDAGVLVPFYVDEALPGDTFRLNCRIFGRMTSSLPVPIMDNMYVDTHFFAVPLRLLWDHFQNFMGERIHPDDNTEYLVPEVTCPPAGFAANSIFDYFGLPVGIPNLDFIAAFHSRGYNLIWNDFYRDQNLQDYVTVDLGDGPDDAADYVLLPRGKRHDYFTSCLPWPQKGPGVELPLGTVAPVVGIGKGNQTFGGTNKAVYETGGTGTVNYVAYAPIDPASADSQFFIEKDTGNFPAIYADLSSATAASIYSLYEAFALQHLLENDARGGTRYTEIVRSHFHVVSPDARLQRPEYLGGGSSMIHVSPVPQTSSTDATTPQGNLAAYGYFTDKHHGFTKSFTEHCVLIGLLSVRADYNYQQGIPRMFSRQTRYDFYWPELAHLGEQAVLNKEIYAQGTGNVNPATGIEYDLEAFGYQERWAEYRYFPGKITGKFRSTDATPLDMYHLAQEFTALPTLGPDFIKEDPPIDRVVAVTDEPQFIVDSLFEIKCARPMPVYSVPGLLNRF